MASEESTHKNNLLRRNESDNYPLLNFKWICTELPFNLDVTYVESIDLNFSNIEVSDGWHGAGTQTYFPGFSNISSFGLTLYEDSAASTMQWIYDWKNLVKTVYTENGLEFSSGAYNLPIHYKRTMKFELLATDNSSVVEISLLGVWPSDTSALTLDYSSSDRVKLSQTFSCDDQQIKFLKGRKTGSFSGEVPSFSLRSNQVGREISYK